MEQEKKKFYGWKMVGLLWLVYFLMQGLVLYGGPVVNSFMVLDMNFARSVLGAGASIFVLFQGLSGPFAAKAINAKGIRFTIISGAFLVIISAVLMATVVNTPLKFLIVFGVMSGVGIGFSGMFSVQSGVTYWFREKRGLALAIALTGASFGGFVAGYVMNLIMNYTGGSWRAVWVFLAITCFVTIVIAKLFVVNRPEDVGQVPDGKVYDESITDSDKKEKRFSKVYKTKVDEKLSDIIKTPKFWYILIALVAIRFSYNIILSQATLHLLDRGIPELIAATAVGNMTLFGALGRLGAGSISDRIEPQKIWVVGMIIFILGFAFLMVANTVFLTILFSVAVGIGFGVSYVTSSAMLGNYYGANTFPTVMGIAFPVQMIAGAIGPVFAGVIFDATQSYHIAFLIGQVVMVVGTLAVVLATPPKMRGEQRSQSKSTSL